MTLIALLVGLGFGIPLALTALVYLSWNAPPADPDAFAMPPGTALRVGFGEWIATVAVLFARPLQLGDQRMPGEGAIVFIPEARCSSAVFRGLRRRLHALGWSSAAIPGAASVAGCEAALLALDACIARIAPAPDAPVVLIGHGLGGIVACRYAARHPRRIRQVVTLATPHQGSAALPYRLLGAAALAAAGATAAGAGADLDVINLYSDYDPWLDPIDNAYCRNGFNVTVRGLGHFTVLRSARVAELVLENVAAKRPATVRPTV